MPRLGWLVWPLVLIAIGALYLADNLSGGTFDAGDFLARWWPVILIALGIGVLVDAVWPGRRPSARTLALDLAGAPRAEVRIDFGAGRLSVGPAAAGHLLDGTFEGGVRYDGGTGGRVRLRSEPEHGWWGFGWGGFAWQVGVARDVPLSLWVSGGASTSRLDLAETLLTDLRLETGASETIVVLPRAAGETRVDVQSGAASVTLHVPEGVAARVLGTMAVGAAHIDPRRFPPAGAGYASPDWSTAPNRIDITFRGGVGSFTVD
jgi:hypothetical protein